MTSQDRTSPDRPREDVPDEEQLDPVEEPHEGESQRERPDYAGLDAADVPRERDRDDE